jgi:hypothetical protein
MSRCTEKLQRSARQPHVFTCTEFSSQGLLGRTPTLILKTEAAWTSETLVSYTLHNVTTQKISTWCCDRIPIISVGFWRWCISIERIVLLDFIHRLVSQKNWGIKNIYTKYHKIDPCVNFVIFGIYIFNSSIFWDTRRWITSKSTIRSIGYQCLPWRRRQNRPLKHRYPPTTLHGVKTQQEVESSPPF